MIADTQLWDRQLNIAGVYHVDVRPLRLKLPLVETTLEQPAKSRHSFHPVQQTCITARVLITLRQMQRNKQQRCIL